MGDRCAAERVPRQCLVINERLLWHVQRKYTTYYNAMRPHRSLGLDSPAGRPPESRPPGTLLSRRAILGGLHHEYAWAA